MLAVSTSQQRSPPPLPSSWLDPGYVREPPVLCKACFSPFGLFQAANAFGLERRRRQLPRCDDSLLLAGRATATALVAAVGDNKTERSEEARLSEDLREWCRSEFATERSSRRPISWGPRAAAYACCLCVCVAMLPRVRLDVCMHERGCLQSMVMRLVRHPTCGIRIAGDVDIKRDEMLLFDGTAWRSVRALAGSRVLDARVCRGCV